VQKLDHSIGIGVEEKRKISPENMQKSRKKISECRVMIKSNDPVWTWFEVRFKATFYIRMNCTKLVNTLPKILNWFSLYLFSDGVLNRLIKYEYEYFDFDLFLKPRFQHLFTESGTTLVHARPKMLLDFIREDLVSFL
jgi:hypothetical protein